LKIFHQGREASRITPPDFIQADILARPPALLALDDLKPVFHQLHHDRLLKSPGFDIAAQAQDDPFLIDEPIDSTPERISVLVCGSIFTWAVSGTCLRQQTICICYPLFVVAGNGTARCITADIGSGTQFLAKDSAVVLAGLHTFASPDNILLQGEGA
jgi:hypothetical protein